MNLKLRKRLVKYKAKYISFVASNKYFFEVFFFVSLDQLMWMELQDRKLEYLPFYTSKHISRFSKCNLQITRTAQNLNFVTLRKYNYFEENVM